MAGVLDGLLVVALEQAVAAPYVSSRLADRGARVIKLERPEGDFARGYDTVANGASAYFVWLNRGKESLALDIKDAQDAALLSRLLAKADVFIENLAPGAAARAGFGSADLRARHPRLITCDISGYGQEGPYRDMKAYDLLIQAESGLVSVTGTPEAPGRVGVSVCDIAAGMAAFAAILEALYARERTGEGAGIEVSLFDGMADWMTVPLLYQENTGAAPARMGLAHPSIAPYGAYPCASGDLVVISIQNEREWVRFCAEVLARPELAHRPEFENVAARVENRAALDAHIHGVFGALGRDELGKKLFGAKIAFGWVNEVADFAKHPQLRRMKVETTLGQVDLVAPPAQFAGEALNLGPVPALDADGAAIREEFSA